jgi:hypothetical protein
MLPLGCLPLWGREGVTLLYTEVDLQVTGKRGFLKTLFFKPIPGQSITRTFFTDNRKIQVNQSAHGFCMRKGT